MITGPGVYLTRHWKKVTIHEIRFPPNYQEGNTCFPAKGSFWKTSKSLGENPKYGIWKLNGEFSIFGSPHPNDIVSKIEEEEDR